MRISDTPPELKVVMTSPSLARAASAILAAGGLAMAGATVALLRPLPDLTTVQGRHLLAGGLANLALSVALVALALGPVRRAEAWAVWLFGAVALVYGVPILVVDAVCVKRERLLVTLAPQVVGLCLTALGIGLGILASRKPRKATGAVSKHHRGA